ASATGINASGQIVGTATRADEITHAFLVSAGKVTDLGTLPGGTFSAASGISNTGAVIGQADNSAGAVVPFLFTNGVMHDMSGAGGFPAQPLAINTAGQVAGTVTTTFRQPGCPVDQIIVHGFLWTPAAPGSLTGTGQDLGEGTVPTAINSAGVVVGSTGGASSTVHAFVMRNGVLVDLNRVIPGDPRVRLTQA